MSGQGIATLHVYPEAWQERPGDVQRAVEELAALLEVSPPEVHDGLVEFPVTTEERDLAFGRWRECRKQHGLLRPPH